MPNAITCFVTVGGTKNKVRTHWVTSFQITQWVNTSSYYFIGLTDLNVEGTFVWGSGRPLSVDVAAHWKSGEPNNHNGNQHCVHVDDFEMWDVKCHSTYRFVCQKRLNQGMHIQTQHLLK